MISHLEHAQIDMNMLDKSMSSSTLFASQKILVSNGYFKRRHTYLYTNSIYVNL